MIDYASDDQLMDVAQSCRYFNSGGMSKSRFNTAEENISCSACRSWNGNRCIRNIYDNVLISMYKG